MRIEWERNWDKPTDESYLRKFQNHTFELLRRYACEHYPILKKIKEREREAEQLATRHIAKEADLPEGSGRYMLERAYKEICEEQGDHTERAKIFQAAMAWSGKRDKIDKLKQKAKGVLYYSGVLHYSEFHYPWYYLNINIDPRDYREEYEARTSLERTIRDVMTEYNDDWDKDYEFREGLENFLNGLASERCCIRGLFESFFLFKNINRYLENPSWHSPEITNFLLVDFIDASLIEWERKFMLGLFPARVADKIRGPDSPFDSLTVRLLEKLYKKIARYTRLAKDARKIVVIRSEIASGTFHAKTLIERLKELEKQDRVVIPSLIYALLELREGQ